MFTAIRVRVSEGIESLRSGLSPRAPAVQVPQLSTREVGGIDLSTAVRALTAALEQELLGHVGRRVHEVLLEQDRLLLTWAYQVFSGAEDAEQLNSLTLELASFRTRSFAASADTRLETHVQLTPELRTASREQQLRLPVLAADDEQLARSVLLHLATRESALDRGFVRSLLEPERTSRVPLRFVQRLVLALLPRPLASTPRREALLERREAHIALAAALRSLDISLAEIEAALPEQLERGIERASRQLTELALQARASIDERSHPFAALTRNDRAVLVLLHAVNAARGSDGPALEPFTRALVTLRISERVDLTSSSDPVERQELEASPSPPAPFEEEPPATPRETPRNDAATSGYGSRTQLAPRAARGYQTLLPPAAAQVFASPSSSSDATQPLMPPAHSRAAADAGEPLLAFVRPLDLRYLLGERRPDRRLRLRHARAHEDDH